MAAAQLQQAAPELAAVEAVAAVAGDGPQRAGDARHPHRLPYVERAVGAQLARTGQGVHEMAGQRQHDGGGKPLLGQLDRRRQHVLERQPPVALVQGEPAVDRAGHLHAAQVVPHRHGRQALGAHGRGIGPGAGPADGEQCLRRRARIGRRHHGQHVAPEPAQVRPHDGHGRPCGHGGVGRRAARASMASPADAASWSAAATMPRRPVREAKGARGSAMAHE